MSDERPIKGWPNEQLESELINFTNGCQVIKVHE